MDKKKNQKCVRVLFAIRIILWLVAAGATFYWIWWSFKLYEMGIHDVYEYAGELRPVFGRCLLISIGSIVISLILRSVSDRIKRTNRTKDEEEEDNPR